MKEKTVRIEIPADVKVTFSNGVLAVEGPLGKLEKKVKLPGVVISVNEKSVALSIPKATRRWLRFLGTAKALILNMFEGVVSGFEYKLEVCFVHFPVSVAVDPERSVLRIKNFLGERKERTAKILPGVEVEVKGSTITVKGVDKSAAGQTAANIEQATKVKGRDRRIFEDGIYITKKPGKRK